jgi:predicted dehydrogenase
VRAAIIGCGKIADQHVQAIRRIPGCEVVAACDREPLMARQLAERFKVPGCFSDVDEMLRASDADVVHITTPPQSHHTLARRCLEAGKHVYLEKPFTVTTDEASSLLVLAQTLGLCITAGHNYQFTPEMLEMRRLVRAGYLGGRPIHLESYWSYDLGDASYVGPLLSNRNHWVRQLPGGLLHNLLSHGLARLVEFLDDDIDELGVVAFQSPRLRGSGAPDVLDELRVQIRDRSDTTATFCFSTQIQPGLNRFCLYGSVNSLTVDLVSGTVIRHPGESHKSYLTFLVPPFKNARQHMANGFRNAVAIARQRLYQDSGMKELTERFYLSISGGAPPLPYRELLATATLMDRIFAQLESTHVMPGASE